MSRTTDELLERLEQFVPDSLRPLHPLFAGEAAALALAERFSSDAARAATWGGTESNWLSLHARSQGTRRRSAETDIELRARLRTPEAQLTRPAIQAGVDALMAEATADAALIIEWWESPYLGETFLGEDPEARLSGGPHSFLVVLPASVGEVGAGEAFLGEGFLGEGYIGVEEDALIGLIAGAVANRKAAGVRAWLVILSD